MSTEFEKDKFEALFLSKNMKYSTRETRNMCIEKALILKVISNALGGIKLN